MNYRDKQIDHLIYKDLIDDWGNATTLPIALREELKQARPLAINATLFDSKDHRTKKALIKFTDNNSVETVLMKYKGRNSVCVSSQIGCPMGCKFCKTGTMGFIRNLSSSEIIEQILYFARLLKKENETIDNIVFMGMGEPFLNYENVMIAIRILNDKDKLNIGARHISLSTCGIINGIEKFTEENLQVNLALSLHAPNDTLRTEIMPINKKQPLANVLEAIRKYTQKTNRKVMFEYIMIKDVNDRPIQALELAELLKQNNLFMVNLIPYNPTGIYKPSTTEEIKRFQEILLKKGIRATQRYSFGQDINAACGQLANSSGNSHIQL